MHARMRQNLQMLVGGFTWLIIDHYGYCSIQAYVLILKTFKTLYLLNNMELIRELIKKSTNKTNMQN